MKKEAEYSFKKGWSQVQRRHIKEVQSKISKALGIETRQAFYNRMSGKVEPKVSEQNAITKIFAEYGIKKVWGDGI